MLKKKTLTSLAFSVLAGLAFFFFFLDQTPQSSFLLYLFISHGSLSRGGLSCEFPQTGAGVDAMEKKVTFFSIHNPCSPRKVFFIFFFFGVMVVVVGGCSRSIIVCLFLGRAKKMPPSQARMLRGRGGW